MTISERTTVKLSASFRIMPELLLVAHKRVPIDARDYIPLMIFNRPFGVAEPTLTRLSEGAIAMSLGRPFGFMQGINNNRLMLESQKTDGIVVAPVVGEEDKWLATFETAEPLTQSDIGLFNYGISFYAAHAEAALHKADPQA